MSRSQDQFQIGGLFDRGLEFLGEKRGFTDRRRSTWTNVQDGIAYFETVRRNGTLLLLRAKRGEGRVRGKGRADNANEKTRTSNKL